MTLEHVGSFTYVVKDTFIRLYVSTLIHLYFIHIRVAFLRFCCLRFLGNRIEKRVRKRIYWKFAETHIQDVDSGVENNRYVGLPVYSLLLLASREEMEKGIHIDIDVNADMEGDAPLTSDHANIYLFSMGQHARYVDQDGVNVVHIHVDIADPQESADIENNLYKQL